jgi:hypothetical protein
VRELQDIKLKLDTVHSVIATAVVALEGQAADYDPDAFSPVAEAVQGTDCTGGTTHPLSNKSA